MANDSSNQTRRFWPSPHARARIIKNSPDCGIFFSSSLSARGSKIFFFLNPADSVGKEGVMVCDFLKCSVDLGKLKDLKRWEIVDPDL